MQIKTKTLKSQNNIFHNMMIFACSYHFKAHLITSESWRLSSEQVYGNISYILQKQKKAALFCSFTTINRSNLRVSNNISAINTFTTTSQILSLTVCIDDCSWLKWMLVFFSLWSFEQNLHSKLNLPSTFFPYRGWKTLVCMCECV